MSGINPLNNEEETKEEREVRERKETKEVVDRLIKGVNDVFEKTYDVEELDLHFTIKIKAPNAVEIGQIQARTAQYLGGMGNFVSSYFIIVYQALSAIRVCGKDVPEFLQKDEEIYNLDVLHMIGRDFQHWLESFRI